MEVVTRHTRGCIVDRSGTGDDNGLRTPTCPVDEVVVNRLLAPRSQTSVTLAVPGPPRPELTSLFIVEVETRVPSYSVGSRDLPVYPPWGGTGWVDL